MQRRDFHRRALALQRGLMVHDEGHQRHESGKHGIKKTATSSN